MVLPHTDGAWRAVEANGAEGLADMKPAGGPVRTGRSCACGTSESRHGCLCVLHAGGMVLHSVSVL